MEQNDAILTFDTLYTTNEIQILKLALPLLPPALQPYAAMLIKGKELQYCMDRLPKAKIEHVSFELSYLDVFFDNALPYCNKTQSDFILRLKQLKQSIDMFEKMKSMMSLFDEDGVSDLNSLFQAFGGNQSSSSAASPEEMLRSVMSDDQADLFEQFKKKFEEEF